MEVQLTDFTGLLSPEWAKLDHILLSNNRKSYEEFNDTIRYDLE